MTEPPTIPNAERLGHDEFVCGHAVEYGLARIVGESGVRCGRCFAPLGIVQETKLCSCQRAGGYDTECLLTGRCSEGRSA